VAEVSENYVVAAPCNVGIEGHRTGDAGEGVSEAGEGALPPTAQLRGPNLTGFTVHERRLLGQPECDIDHPPDVGGCHVQPGDRGVELSAQPLGLCSQVLLGA